MSKLPFASDYMEGCHPNILKRLEETNFQPHTGYGLDAISDAAKEKIRAACAAPAAEVEFLTGGTQTNMVVIDCLLRPYEGVISAESGHVNVHEAGAIEFTGHKVMALPTAEGGKLTAAQIDAYVTDRVSDGNYDHMVHPGLVYLSEPNEYGVLYSLPELTAISQVCHKHHILLYVDGARLAYGLGSSANDVTLPDLVRLADAFYIGGTKCGALLGEAVVLPRPSLIPHFFTLIKMHGALLAKGWVAGIQFDELFKDGLYFKIGKTADAYAARIKTTLLEKGFPFPFDSQTNQLFFIATKEQQAYFAQYADYAFGEKYDDTRDIIRFCTSWATKGEDVEELCRVIAGAPSVKMRNQEGGMRNVGVRA